MISEMCPICRVHLEEHWIGGFFIYMRNLYAIEKAAFTQHVYSALHGTQSTSRGT